MFLLSVHILSEDLSLPEQLVSLGNASIVMVWLTFSLLTKYLATLAKINKSEKSPIIINVCIHRRTVWKTGSYAKYVILLKYRDYYYYYNSLQALVTPVILYIRSTEQAVSLSL